MHAARDISGSGSRIDFGVAAVECHCARRMMARAFDRNLRFKAQRIDAIGIGGGDLRMRGRIVRIGLDRFLQMPKGMLQTVSGVKESPTTPQQIVEGREVGRRPPARVLDCEATEMPRYCADDCLHDFVLDLEDSLERAVIALRPHVCPGRGVDQLSRYAHAVAGLAHAADPVNAEFAPDILDPRGPPLIVKRGISRDDEEVLEAREFRDDVFCHAVREVLPLSITAHVHKRQDDDGRLLGCDVGRRDRNSRCPGDPIDPHRLGDILQSLRPEIVEASLDFVPDVVIGGPGDQDAARLGDAFEPRRYVDAVAIEITALDNHVTQIDTDAQHDAPLLGLIAVRGGHALLEIDRALHGVDSAGELHQHAVAGNLKDAALMLGDQGFQDLLTAHLEGSQRAGFVDLHQAAVTDYIHCQNRGQTAFHAYPWKG
jgi:hypothetical protein